MVQPRDKALSCEILYCPKGPPHAMRKLLSALILTAGLLVAPVAAHADSITYNLVLTPTVPGSNVGSGSGTLTLDTAPGVYNYTVGSGLIDLTFNIGGDTFCLSSDGCVGTPFSGGDPSVFILGSNVYVTYLGGLINPKEGFNFSLSAGPGGYIFSDVLQTGDNGLAEFSSGTISAIDPPAVPEPSALLLFGTGALGLAGIVARKLAA